MTDLATYALGTDVVLLVAGFAYAAVADFREREVSDRLWQVLGIAGFLIGFLGIAPGGAEPTILWTVVGLFVIQHLFAWDLRLGPHGERYADLIEAVVYVSVVAIVAVAAARWGVGPNAVPIAVIAVLVSVLFARGLFEGGILYGGADAKALMIAAIMVPIFTPPLLSVPASVAPVTAFLPFAVNVLMNSALFSVAIPVVIAVRNLRAHEFHGLSAFTGYSISVAELPHQFVWVRDPTFGDARQQEQSIETSEDDRRRREEIARDLQRRGVARVWVTPQIPFVVVMAFGVGATLLAGNVLFDVLFSL